MLCYVMLLSSIKWFQAPFSRSSLGDMPGTWGLVQGENHPGNRTTVGGKQRAAVSCCSPLQLAVFYCYSHQVRGDAAKPELLCAQRHLLCAVGLWAEYAFVPGIGTFKHCCCHVAVFAAGYLHLEAGGEVAKC